MADSEQLKLLKEGVAAWNAWRLQHPEIRPDLREASLAALDLRGVNLVEADIIVSGGRGTAGEEGTGFGMPLMHRFVKQFGGHVDVTSRTVEDSPDDHGTEFKIWLKRV